MGRAAYQLVIVAVLLLQAGCTPRPEASAPPASAPPASPPVAPLASDGDPHSFSEPDRVRVEHLALDLRVDFEARTLDGRALLDLDHAAASRLILDTRDLEIHGVFLGDGTPAGYRLGVERPPLGRPLIIDLPAGTGQVLVEYSTVPEAAALQWLEPVQTAGGAHPFLFTQSQAILARTWVPIQDTPQVRFTFEAAVEVPAGLLALMGAENPQQVSADGRYRFRMPQPIPSYLLALAVGDLSFAPLGPTTGVYAEAPLLEQATWELADTQQMIEAVEALYGPYRWGRYDLLVLPPSFPYGGRENPRLTFLTPTILAGDRSLVALIAHELAHSWSGNLVTNASWNDFWLNEGMTSYLENRIMEALFGSDRAEMLAELGFQDLQRDLERLPPQDQRLALDLAGRDPDEGMTRVAYQKGALFLRMLEESVGRGRWDPFLRSWFEEHAFSSVTTEDFLRFLEEELLGPGEAEALKVETWVRGPGIPGNAPRPEAAALRRVEQEQARWMGGAPARELDTEGWVTHQWLHFLRHLPGRLAPGAMEDLDHAFEFTDTGNSEILSAWLLQAVARDYRPAFPALERFLTSMGRNKFLRPLYTALAKTPEGATLARRIYQRARPTYHPLSQEAVDAILGWEE